MTDHKFRVVIKSIGTASPAASISVAKGLGLPASTVVSRFYSAPAILIDNIDKPTAENVTKLLCGIGYEATAEESVLPPPTPPQLYDVAIYITDARKFQHAVKVVTNFTGINRDDASRMILLPPGVILGAVSEATVQAFTKILGSGISVLYSPPDTAKYNIFISEQNGSDSIINQRIVQDLINTGIDLCAHSGLVATNINYSLAQQLWRRHQSSGIVRIVNQEFLRFDLVLASPVNKDEIKLEQKEAIERLAEVPSDMICEVLQAAPITLLESVPSSEVANLMEAFANVGLNVIADMTTYQMLGLEVLSLPNSTSTRLALESLDLYEPRQPLPQVPFTLPEVMPETRARVVRTALEDTGASVAFVEEYA